MIRVGDMITVEVRLDESKVRVEAIQLAGRSVTLTVSLSERANLELRSHLHYKVAINVSAVACRTLQPVDSAVHLLMS